MVQYIGGGGMGRVFRAIDTRLGRQVALKVLSPEQAADGETLLRFHNEARSAARLDHENIARAYYVGEDRGLHYIAFEYVDGVNLRALIDQKGSLSLAEAVSYTLQVAEALHHAASRDVVHRDVKPSNVLIAPDGKVKLIDMGLARMQKENPLTADLTATGVTLGTFDYISPEQARDPRTADVRSDIYSLGCTFFYMLAGRPPFPEGTVLQKLLRHQADEPPDIRQFRPELPEEAARIVRKMLAKEPDRRYANPTELVRDLLGLAEHVGLQPTGFSSRVLVVPRAPKTSAMRRHLPWLAPMAALVCIVFVLDYLARRDQQSTLPGDGPNGAPAVETALPYSGTVPKPLPAMDTAESGQGQATPGTTLPSLAEEPAGEATVGDLQPSLPNGGKQAPARLPATQPSKVAESPAVRPATPQTGPAEAVSRFPGSGASAASTTSIPSPGIEGKSTTETLPTKNTTTGPSAKPVDVRPTAEGTLPTGTAESRAGLLIVNERVEGENQYASLAAACAAATNGDVIELRYDGRRVEQPVKLANLKVTIRSGEGYRPVLTFRPGKDAVDPVKYPHAMFSTTAGRLTLIGLTIELEIPRTVPVDRWSMFETQGGQNIRLQQCVLTIKNASDSLAAYHEEVAFFRTKRSPAANLTLDYDATVTPPATLEFVDCMARGEAALLRNQGAQPVHVDWDNGLLILSDPLLVAGGGDAPEHAGVLLQVDLRHMTIVAPRGLCVIRETPFPLNAHLRCIDSIVVGSPGVPLIEQVGTGAVEDIQRMLLFNGDRNFYEDIDVFWVVRTPGQEEPLVSMTFDQWQTYWGAENENLPEVNRAEFSRQVAKDLPLNSHEAADYLLPQGDTGENAALRAASDGGDAGFRADRLPTQITPAD